MSEQLRVGIAGFGIIGNRRRHFIDLHPNLKTVAVCDRKFESHGVFDDGLKFYTNYKDLLKEEQLDILFVCLTNDVAAEVTIAGLKNNLHVFCEKPPGRDLDDIAKVIEVQKEYSHLRLMYGFNHRYHDSVRKALQIVKSKELGNVLNLRAVYGKSKIISFKSDWRTKRELSGGGILLDQGIHMVDLLRLFAGDFEEIHSFIDNSHWGHDVEDNAYALMKNKDGVIAFLHSTATEWRHRFRLEIALEKGSINLTGILSGSKSYGAETIRIAYKNDDDEGDPREETVRYNTDNSWRDEIADFAKAVLANKPITKGSSQEAFKTVELVYRIYCADPKWRDQFNLKSVVTEK